MIDFYNLHGYVVKKIRFDAGSTENALETVQFLEINRIQVDPAAVKSQFQIEREAQTLNKGVAALLIDQSSLGPSFWDYVAESWVHTANHTTGSCSVEGRSPLEIVTGRVPDISRDFRFPFGFPVVSHKTEERDHHYATKSDIGIAVGSSARSNRSVLVFIPSKGTCAWERHDVREHKIITKGAATELEKESLGSIIGEDWSSIQFQSAAPKTGDLSIPRSHDHQPGTLGFSDFGIHSRASRPKDKANSSLSSSLDPGDGSPVSTAPLGRRTTRATSVGLVPPPTATAIVADYASSDVCTVSLGRSARRFSRVYFFSRSYCSYNGQSYASSSYGGF